MFLLKNTVHPLTEISRKLRLQILDTIYYSGFGHLAGSFSSLDLILALYHSGLFNFDKDHFILSAGHLCLAHYAVLAEIKKSSLEFINRYSEFGSPFQGHESIEVPGVEYSSGSLGQGLSFAAGLALGDKDRHTVCLTTDSEHNEGQIWEAIQFAHKYHQGNLINIVDYNRIQLGGFTKEIMPLDELASKYLRFGWTVTTVNGHNFYELIKAIKKAKDSSIYPACIIAKTIPAHGISFMENNPEYHDLKNLTQEVYQRAQQELLMIGSHHEK